MNWRRHYFVATQQGFCIALIFLKGSSLWEAIHPCVKEVATLWLCFLSNVTTVCIFLRLGQGRMGNVEAGWSNSCLVRCLCHDPAKSVVFDCLYFFWKDVVHVANHVLDWCLDWMSRDDWYPFHKKYCRVLNAQACVWCLLCLSHESCVLVLFLLSTHSTAQIDAIDGTWDKGDPSHD